MICALLSFLPNIITSADPDSHAYFSHHRQPLHMAAANGHIYVAQELLAASADIEANDQYVFSRIIAGRF